MVTSALPKAKRTPLPTPPESPMQFSFSRHFSGLQNPRKITIKNFNAPRSSPDRQLEDGWVSISSSINSVFSGGVVTTSKEVLYSNVESICRNGSANGLAQRVSGLIRERVQVIMDNLQGVGSKETVFLRKAGELWIEFMLHITELRSFLLPLDQRFLGSSRGTSLRDIAKGFMCEYFAHNDQVLRCLLASILNGITAQRNGEEVSDELIAGPLGMLKRLGLYHHGDSRATRTINGTPHALPTFEKHLLMETCSYYRKEGATLIAALGGVRDPDADDVDVAMDGGMGGSVLGGSSSSSTLSGEPPASIRKYLEHVTKRVDEEKSRVQRYLATSTRRALLQWVYHSLVDGSPSVGAWEFSSGGVGEEKPYARRLASGFSELASNNDVGAVKTLYGLLKEVSAQEFLQEAVSEYVETRGGEIVGAKSSDDPTRDKVMVSSLVKFRAQMDLFLRKALGNSSALKSVISRGFERFLNKRGDRPAELLVLYLHSILRGAKGIDETNVDSKISSVLSIFRHVQGKDAFEGMYKAHLAKRLLHQRYASLDWEKLAIKKLKQECGQNFTRRLETMLSDIGLSGELFRSYLQTQGGKDSTASGVEFSTVVLNRNEWPTYKEVDVDIPPAVEVAQEAFSEFYHKKHANRKLQWQPSLAQCVVSARFPSGEKELVVNAYHALVLQLFAPAPKAGDVELALTRTEICVATGIPEREIDRTLLSLACGKARVLRKEPIGPQAATDKYLFNHQFTDRRFRIRISNIILKTSKEETAAVRADVGANRVMVVDSTIVRLMKTHQSLPRQQLISETIAVLSKKFTPTIKQITTQLESLERRDFIEPQDDNPDVYNYVS